MSTPSSVESNGCGVIEQNIDNNNNNNIKIQIMSSNNSYNNNNNNNNINNNNLNNGSLSPSSSIHNFSLLNDIYFQNTNDVNELINKSSHGFSISAGSIANINSGTSSNIHAMKANHNIGFNNATSSISGGLAMFGNGGSGGNISGINENGTPGYDVDLIVQTTKQEDSRFMGKKKRRNSSISKVFLGDFLRLSSNVSILKMISKYGDNTILFSDVLIKVNKRNKMQERIIIITDKSIYNVDPKDYKLKRRISLENVTSISMSTMEDNFIIIHVNSEYDYVLVGGRKIEIATILLESYHRLTFYQITPYTIPNSINQQTNNNNNNNTTSSISIPSSSSSSLASQQAQPQSSPILDGISSSSSSTSQVATSPSKIPSPPLKSTGSSSSNNNSTATTTASSNSNSTSPPQQQQQQQQQPINNIGILTPNNNNSSNYNSNVSVIHRITGSVLPVNLTDRIEYRIEGDSLREIIFTRIQGAVNISIQSVKSKPSLKKELSRSSILPNSPNSSIK